MPHRSLRILFVASSSELGGAEQSILDVIRHVDPARLVPSVLTLMGDGPLSRLASQAGTPATTWSLRGMANPFLLHRMSRFLAGHDCDLVQCFGLRAELLTRWTARAKGLKVVSSIRSVDDWRRPRHVLLDRLTSGAVTAWISNSEAGKKTRIKREKTPPERIFVVPNGIPDRPPADADGRARARRRLKLTDSDAPVLAVVANITRAKGHADLIEALALLKERWPNLVCLCAGRDDSSGVMQRLAEAKGVDSMIRWLGFVPDVGGIYDAADLTVLTSHWEGMPHALIETLRAGLPSVATDVGGVPEVVRHEKEGLLCRSGSPQSIADALTRALEDEAARKAWGEAARRRYEECFRVELMVERLTELYEKLVVEKG